MTILTSQRGLSLGHRTMTMNTRRMLAFAAGIGDLNPRVFDDLDPGFMASPALCVALEWPLLSDPAILAQLMTDPRDMQRAVHLTQDSHFHRPMRSGDRLTTSGTVSGIWRGPAGVRVACTLHTTDADGAAIVTSHTSAVYRGIDADGDDQPAEGLPALPSPPDYKGPAQTAVFVIDAAMPHRYTECADIWHPIHTERRIAKGMGLPGVILHGTASWALAGAEIVSRLADGNPARLKRLNGRFGNMVFPGTSVQLLFHSSRRGAETDVFFTVTTPDGQIAIADGLAVIADSDPPCLPVF